jgi:hypothetical protein
MTFGGGNLHRQSILVAWQNRSQLTTDNSGHSNSQLIFNLLNTPILRKTVFRLCAPPPIVISQTGLTLKAILLITKREN